MSNLITADRKAAVLEHTSQQSTIAAPPNRCYDVVLEFERYPEWADGIDRAEVLSRDPEGRPLDVGFSAGGMGRQANYVLRYDHSAAPQRLSWHLIEGDVMGRLDGYYEFEPVQDDSSSCEVTYDLEVELLVGLPGFVRRRAEDKILRAALPELKLRVESLIS
ncbi:MAG: cyclase [Actinomycetia bacterium]|nr:cyclase [Actinomycetes bacterium]MCP4085972.1 cyclase [Actinomycetes bacterium]